MVKSGVRSVERFDSGEALVKGDLIQLRQLLLNLIQNAVEAMPSGGTVTVETGKERDLLRINIRDTGPGIPRESKPKIFTAFFTTKSEGLGLGLFSAKRIAQEHGGRIEIQSEEGTGTCFTVLLPSGK
jgi:signal transduction histidine kinase